MSRDRPDYSLPYITNDLPGISGRIREKPEDFIVEEVALFKPNSFGDHLYVSITKIGVVIAE